MQYTEQHIPESRRRLASLIREAGDVIRVQDAAEILDLDATTVAKMLARWTKQGWLRRVGQGVYVGASLDSLEREHVLDDPWVLVPALFSPCYVGGRTAAEHWDLTEQIFNDIVVFTSRNVREKSQTNHGANFTLTHIDERKLFGTRPVWRGHSKVMVSDPHKTIIDMLDNPAIGGGIQQVADCLSEYFKLSDCDDDKLIEYAERLGNGAVFKRLGFLTERMKGHMALEKACKKRLTKGNAKLDPNLETPRLITRWHLLVPDFWLKEGMA